MAAASAGSGVSSARQLAALGASSASLDTCAPSACRRAAAACWCASSALTSSAASSSASTSPSVAPQSAQPVMGSRASTQLDTCRQPRLSLSSSMVGPSMRCCLATKLRLSAASASHSLPNAAPSFSTGAVSVGDEPARCACRTAVASLAAACMRSSLSRAGCFSASPNARSRSSSSVTCASLAGGLASLSASLAVSSITHGSSAAASLAASAPRCAAALARPFRSMRGGSSSASLASALSLRACLLSRSSSSFLSAPSLSMSAFS
mmetsp:Transcript_10666/g.21617  ORF Transcript_10666/g.21617 Transcript_10666/m.21617 type:complete len:266 (-) Transcript_10666:388-1185(-)